MDRFGLDMKTQFSRNAYFKALAVFSCFILPILVAACTGHDSDPDTASSLKSPKTAKILPGLSGQKPGESPENKSVTLLTESLPYIKVQEVKAESLAGVISAPARVDFRAQAISSTGTAVSGRITKIYVQVGDRIKAGAPLATLSSVEATQMRSDYARAKAELGRAEDHYRRQLEMQRAGVGLEIERVEAATQLKEARTNLERSRDFLHLLGRGIADEVTVRAPFDSMVLKAYVSVGAAVGNDSPLFDLGEPSAAWIVADVFERDLALVEKGAKAVIELASLPDPIHGHVVAESAAIQSDLRRAAVFIEADDTKVALRPGMYARAFIETTGPGHIFLPASAILIRDGKTTLVYIEKSTGVFEPRIVQVGQAWEGLIPILKGLSGGERVVVSGALLIDGEAAMLL
jgi:cobalt-zinc-cadmium efflux system membrane fusion protein